MDMSKKTSNRDDMVTEEEDNLSREVFLDSTKVRIVIAETPEAINSTAISILTCPVQKQGVVQLKKRGLVQKHGTSIVGVNKLSSSTEKNISTDQTVIQQKEKTKFGKAKGRIVV